MSAELDTHISELQHTVTVAARNFEVWWTYKSQRPSFIEAMQRYSFFFETSIHAHFVALLVALYRLYETRPNTFNIPSLLSLLKGDNAFDKATLSRLDTMHRDAKPLWVKVSILRNKVFGHRSVAHTIDEAFKEAGVNPNELRDLIERTKELLNVASHDPSVDVSETGKDLILLLTDIKQAGAA